MIFAAILAGGVGYRMGRELPKQFLTLGEMPVIVHSLKKFLACPEVDRVFIGVHADWIDHTEHLVRTYVPENVHRVRILCGGAGRNDTLQNIIAAIDQEREGSEEDIILTHDAARPFVTLRMIRENIEAARRVGAVNTVVPAVDTIVESRDGKTITDIPNKAYMYYGHSPQSFRINLLKRLYSTLTEAEKSILTDACKICALRGQEVALVQSEYTNLKITTPGDYLIAKAYVENGVGKE